MEEAYEGGLNMFQLWIRSKAARTEMGTLICILENIFEPHLSLYMPLCLVVSLGGSKTRMESSAAKKPPS